MRERAAFNRRWKAQEWLRVRTGEIETFTREEARRVEEARLRREQEIQQEIQNAQSAKAASDALKSLIERNLDGSILAPALPPMNITPN